MKSIFKNGLISLDFVEAIDEELRVGKKVVFVIKQNRPEGIEETKYDVVEIFPQNMCHVVDEYAQIEGKLVRTGYHHEPNTILPFCFGDDRVGDRIDVLKRPTNTMFDRWLDDVLVS